MAKIIIDAGHGGRDPGAEANNLQEKDITLLLSKYMEEHLNENYPGHEVKVTRSNDIYLELAERANIANTFDADVFISNHVNAGGGTGFESFIYTKPSSGAISLQKSVNAEALNIATKYGLDAHGEDQKRGNFAVVRETKMPAILTEICFIDSGDAKLLKEDAFLRDMAAAYARGVAEFLGLKADKQAISKSVKIQTSGLTPVKQVISKSIKIQTGGLTPVKIMEVSEFFLKKKWYAEITFTGEGNPKALTGGLTGEMQEEFELWLNERNWYYRIIEK